MMLKLAVFLGIIGLCQALVCMPFLCKGATFDATKCKGTVIKGGGFCGCTDACAKVEGEACQAATALFGGVSGGKCDDGLNCVAPNGPNPFGRGLCTKSIIKRSTRTVCEQRRISAMIIMVIYQGQWTPRCDTQGQFIPKQCDNTGSCFCVDVESGKLLTARSKVTVKC